MPVTELERTASGEPSLAEPATDQPTASATPAVVRRRGLSLTHKLLGLVGGAMVLVLAAGAVLQHRSLSELFETRVTDTELPAQLREIQSGISGDLSPGITVSRAMATNSYLLDWIARGEPAAELPAVRAYLDGVKEAADAPVVFYVSGPTQTYYDENGVFKTMSPDVEKDSWFYGFLASGNDYELNLDVDETSGTATVFVNYAVKAGSEVLGAIGVGYPVDTMIERVNAVRLGDTGFVYLADGSGAIKVHPHRDGMAGATMADIPGLEDQLEGLLQGEGVRTATYTDETGEVQIAAAIDLPEIGWVAVAQQPQAELLGDLHRALTDLQTVTIVIALVGLALIGAVSYRLTRPVKVVAHALSQIGERGGDLRTRLEVNRRDELGWLADGFNAFVERLQITVGEVVRTGEQLQDSVGTVTEQTEQSSTWIAEQSEKTNLVAAAVHEMATTVTEIARNTSDAAISAGAASATATEGGATVAEQIETVRGLATAMQEGSVAVTSLREDVDSITSVLEVISAIAEQTNLLALNATIEAARAGEAGKGFGVVADEVKTLAQRAQSATEEIRRTVERLQTSAGQVVGTMEQGMLVSESAVERSDQAGAALEEIAQVVGSISEMSQQIAAATEEQSAVTDDVTRNVTDIATLSHRTAESAAAQVVEADRMRRLALRLGEMVSQFQV